MPAHSNNLPVSPLFLDVVFRGIVRIYWAHLDLNQGPTDYESATLTN
jgi:hypothetical protein